MLGVITLREVAPKIAPEKLPFDPNRKPDRLPLPPFFRGKLAVKLRGCTSKHPLG